MLNCCVILCRSVTIYVVTCPDFRTPVTTDKTAEMQAIQGVASTVQGAYLDFCTLHGATEKVCRFAPNAEASPTGFYFP